MLVCCDIERTLVHALGMWGIVEKLWVYIRKIDCMSKEKSMLTKFALWFCVVCVVPLWPKKLTPERSSVP